MSHTAEIPRAGRSPVRSSAEAAVPPPALSDRAAALSRFEHAITEALAVRDTGEPVLPTNLADGGADLDPPESLDRREGVVLLRAALAALHDPDLLTFHPSRAGFGSIVHVHDLRTDESTRYEIVPLDLVDGSLARVTAASPIGRALTGASEGDIVEYEAPSGRRSVRVDDIRTLLHRLDELTGRSS